MWLWTEKIEACFRKVKQIQEHQQAYCLAPDRLKLSVEDLQWVISDMYAIKIEKREVAFEAHHVRGLVERYPKRARILVRKNMEEDWLRFVTVKELCQIAICEPEDWSPDGTTTLDRLIEEKRLDHLEGRGTERKDHTPPHDPIQSERLAEVAAVELMYPHRYRAADLAAIAAQTTTVRALAVQFHAPEYVIGFGLAPSHYKVADEFWTTGKVTPDDTGTVEADEPDDADATE